ncbi:hydroxymethylglutaryl-CoA lyase [Erythrobacter mangrovi]|uniref:Hydroxymethylglutaryl-CoA lyase n=1 Tax=Erythrobacter mangrovi TaxID=2739433 RepID=A0A7D3XI66_9SPHN|nr:hydroxymethylglutaryl-CoA lyase [Erythrobacter mangrovi]QKG71598.1 hydroxymethylglutaryl-CoA lyase [Erythrobacter mangrovi]
MAEEYPSAIEMVEVGPRDGLQNEKLLVSTEDKLALIERAIAAGSRRIEVASFVNPRAVPQMADAELVCEGLTQRDDVTYIGLVMNDRGAERAIGTGRIDQLGAVAVATDRFAMANQGQTSQGSVEAARAIIARARSAGLTGQATIAVAFGCPFEGEVSQDRIVAMAAAIAEVQPEEIGLADTVGVADPAHVARLVEQVREAVAPIPVRVHFHNTRGTGLANVWAAIGVGARIVDASIGGIGGCPFAPAATGNVATEDVAYMLERAGIQTGLDLEVLLSSNHWLAEVMGRQLPSMVGRAGLFPRPGTTPGESVA